MDLRLIELMLPRESAARLETILRDHEKNIFWKESPGASELRTRILVSAEKTEAIADVLEKEFKGTEGFRILLLPLEASIPRLEPREGEKTGATVPGEASKQPRQPPRICREELYGDIAKTANLTWIFVILVVLSTLVASVGILRDSVIATSPWPWRPRWATRCWHGKRWRRTSSVSWPRWLSRPSWVAL